MKKAFALVLCLALLLLPAGCAQKAKKTEITFPETFIGLFGTPEEEALPALGFQQDGDAKQYYGTVPLLDRDCSLTLAFQPYPITRGDPETEGLLNYIEIDGELPNEAASLEQMRSLYDAFVKAYGEPYNATQQLDGLLKGDEAYDADTLFGALAKAAEVGIQDALIDFQWREVGENGALVHIRFFSPTAASNGNLPFDVMIMRDSFLS